MTDRIWIWFADNGNIRKWQREPFEEGTEFVSAIVPADVAEALERLEKRVSQAEKSRQEMIEADVNGWPNAVLGLIEAAEEAVNALASISADLAAVKAENSDLVKERDRAMQWRDHDKERAEAAESCLASERAAHARTREALEPFTRVKIEWASDLEDETMCSVLIGGESGNLDFTLGDLRAARLAYQGGSDK